MRKMRKLIFSLSAILSVFSVSSLVIATSESLDVSKNEGVNISGNISSIKEDNEKKNELLSFNDENKPETLGINKNDDTNISEKVSSIMKEENKEASVKDDFNKDSNTLNKDTINEDNNDNKDEGFNYLNDMFKDSSYYSYDNPKFKSDSKINGSKNKINGINNEDNDKSLSVDNKNKNESKEIIQKEYTTYKDGSTIETTTKAIIKDWNADKTDYLRDEDIVDTHVEEKTTVY